MATLNLYMIMTTTMIKVFEFNYLLDCMEAKGDSEHYNDNL